MYLDINGRVIKSFLEQLTEVLKAYGRQKNTWGNKYEGFCLIGGARHVRDRFARMGVENAESLHETAMEKLRGCIPGERLIECGDFASAQDCCIYLNDRPSTTDTDVFEVIECAKNHADDTEAQTATRVETAKATARAAKEAAEAAEQAKLEAEAEAEEQDETEVA